MLDGVGNVSSIIYEEQALKPQAAGLNPRPSTVRIAFSFIRHPGPSWPDFSAETDWVTDWTIVREVMSRNPWAMRLDCFWVEGLGLRRVYKVLGSCFGV